MRTTGIKIIGSLLVCSVTVNGAFSQSLPDSVISKIDNLFAKWNNENSPGCTIGIVRNDSLIYAKGYGMANLEHGIPNTAETISYIASASKPFTAYSIILLARQGKINFNDDIHKYLPWFPDVNEKITISHLLKNTSGIRDLWQLLAISGTRLDDVVRTNHVLKLLGKQQTLNFKPGSYHNSSTSDFTLLAEVVKSVTGQSLRSFTDSAIFNPLRMYTTHFYDNYRETIKNRASSYVRTDSIHFETRIVNYSNVGETGVQTNINDMSKWVMNFYEPKLGDLEDIDQLTMKIKLDNGKEPPAEGMPPDSYKGWRQFWYIGGFAGYRSFVTVIPKLKIGFIVFSNVDDLDPVAKVYEIADLFIKENMQKGVVQNPQKDTSAATLRDPLAIRKFLGDYISENGVQTSFQIEKGKLFSHVGNLTWLWVDEGGNNFSAFNYPDAKIIFMIKGKDTTAIFTEPGSVDPLKKYIKDAPQPDRLLKTYTGTYYCPELDCKYSFVLKDHRLVLTNKKYDDAPLTLIGTEHLMNDFWWMRHLLITRNRKNEVTGFEVHSEGGIKHLRFNKIE